MHPSPLAILNLTPSPIVIIEPLVLCHSSFGIMNNAVPVCLWFVLASFAWLPGAHLGPASAITLFLVGYGLALVWGVLGGSMPRSGGSYVYNLRIIQPSWPSQLA